MSHVQRKIKFKDRVQVLEFKKKQFVANLLKCAEEPEEDITDVQKGVGVMFCSLLLLFFYLIYFFVP